MKYRAPRCNELMLSGSLFAGSSSTLVAANVDAVRNSVVMAPKCLIDLANMDNSLRPFSTVFILAMVNHPVRNRLRLVYSRVIRHEQEEREIQNREDSRHHYVNTFCWLHAEPTQRAEADDEQCQ